MSRFLSVILCLSWAMGCFPVKNPLRTTGRFHFSWFHPIVFISIAILIFDVALMLDFGIHSIESYAATTLGDGLAALIAESAFVFYIIIGDAGLRIIALALCRQIAELIHMIEFLEQLRNNQYRFCVYMYRVYIVICMANVLNFTHESLIISNIVNVFKPVPNYINMTILPRNDWIIRGAFWCQNIFSTASHSFGISIFLLLGTHLVSLYLGYCNEIGRCWGGRVTDCSSLNKSHTYEWMGDVDTFLDRWVEKFTKLKQAYAVFSTVSGPLVFSLIFSGLTALIHSVYSMSATKAMANITGTVGCIFWIGFLSYFGNFMEGKILEVRDRLRDAMVTKQVGHPRVNPDHLREVTEWVANWKWKLSAGNLFRVNNSLLPAVLGTSMTYVIFVFQLRMSEIHTSHKY